MTGASVWVKVCVFLLAYSEYKAAFSRQSNIRTVPLAPYFLFANKQNDGNDYIKYK